jgi:hypothetical protein
MRFVLSIAAAGALALSVGVSAQDATKKPAAEHTMTGCLAKGTADGTYLVKSTAEKGPKTVGIVSSGANLGPHVNHKIDITGTAVPNAEAEAMKPAPPKADHYMKISTIKMVSATCP